MFFDSLFVVVVFLNFKLKWVDSLCNVNTRNTVYSLNLIEDYFRSKSFVERRGHHPRPENYTNKILLYKYIYFKKEIFMKTLNGLYFKLAYEYFYLWTIFLCEHCSQVGIIYHPDIDRYRGKKKQFMVPRRQVYILCSCLSTNFYLKF